MTLFLVLNGRTGRVIGMLTGNLAVSIPWYCMRNMYTTFLIARAKRIGTFIWVFCYKVNGGSSVYVK